MNLLGDEVRRRVKAEVWRACERLEAWNTRLTAYALAMKRGEISQTSYAAEVELWRVQLSREVRLLHLMGAAAGNGLTPLRGKRLEQIEAQWREPLAWVDELGRAWVEKPPTSPHPLMVVRSGTRAEAALWSAVETFDFVRNERERDPAKAFETKWGYEELNVCHSRKPCSECAKYQKDGWQPKGTFPLPGRRKCWIFANALSNIGGFPSLSTTPEQASG